MSLMGITFGALLMVLLSLCVDLTYKWMDGDWRKACQQTIAGVFLILFWMLLFVADWNLAQKFSAFVALVLGLGFVALWLEEK